MYNKLVELILKMLVITVTFLLGATAVLGIMALLKLLINFIW